MLSDEGEQTKRKEIMEKKRQEEIIEILRLRNAIQPCPRCRNLMLEIIGETKIPLSDRRNPITLAQPELPVILVSCGNCGYITHHAKGVLGLTG